MTDEKEVFDLEEYATRGELPPEHARRFRIRVDRVIYVVDGPHITGRQILEISAHVPPNQWRLDQRFRGGATKKIELDQVVDLRTCAVERFMTLPLDQTEGGM